MDNRAIARVLAETADLLEIKAENPFKIRAYRNAADIAANHPHELATLDAAALREIPGIGKDLAARILEIAETGDTEFHRTLLAEFPPTVLELLRLQGVGPKTVATLYRELGVRSLEDLEQAARDGRVRSLRGMGPKKEALILSAIEERRRHADRFLLSEAARTASAIAAFLTQDASATTVTPVGSLRRGVETCGDLDLLSSDADVSLMDTLLEFPAVERVLGHGPTKSSVRLSNGMQVDLRIVPPGSRGAAEQYFTGSKAHNIALRDRATGLGLKLNEYGLFTVADNTPVAGADEAGIYEALGLAWIPPELRENRGEIAAAETRTLPRLVERSDLRGDLHAHTTATDGKDDIRAMADAAAAAGLEYLAITDHSQALAMANGLDERRAMEHAAAIRAIDREGSPVRLLAGIECDIRPDGTLDLDDECLASLDIVVASVHSAFSQSREEMTDRVLRALANPHVDVLGHPTGRLLLKRSAYPLDMERVIDAAAAQGVAIEINSQAKRLDLNDVYARLAHERGVRLVVSSDAHSRAAFASLDWGVVVARRAWLEAADVLNTLPFEALTASLRRRRLP